MFITDLFFINFLIFIFSIIGIIFSKHNFILVLVSIEIGFLSISILYVLISIIFEDLYGQIFTIFIITIAGGESSLAISFMVYLDKFSVVLNSESINYLKG